MSVQSVALASLTATYTDSEGEDGVEDERLQEENSNTPQGAAPHNAQVGRQPQARSGTSPISGGRSASHSPAVGKSAGSSDLPEAATKVQRLVSYFDDAVVSDDEGVTAVVVPPPPSVPSVPPSSSLMTAGAAIVTTVAERPEENGLPVSAVATGNVATAAAAAAAAATTVAAAVVAAVGGGAERRSPSSRSGELLSDNGGEDSYGVTIPPEPSGQCPAELQDKIARLYRKMESGGLDMNMLIQQRKEFRNPSIYEKLIQFCSINELGTNYPPDRFDPFKWNKDSYYEELALVQKAEMDKLEKARKEKTKIEIVSGTAKRPNSSSSGAAAENADAKKRKSKWDQVATGGAAAAAAVAAAAAAAVTAKPTVLLTQPTLTTLTSSGTSAKPTVLSAFGSLPKKRL
ncbi:PREDICTED: SAP30-binding protein [Wasmannia auropunctata]|uniref:SAP30-binding protein n=1 Tax=Wasmannia auropunctata TaxID=64793 RepID=UPI0005ED4444|nr:PREDICTED: SAP30-binding protein [Wasmannia auropunctata]